MSVPPPAEKRPRQAQSLLRRIPKVDGILAAPSLAPLIQTLGPGLVTFHTRRVVQKLRESIQSSASPTISESDLTSDAVASRVAESMLRDAAPLPRILNGTGVVLHSGLGRAPIPQVAVESIARAGGYSLLEVERNEGHRHARDSRAGELLRSLTGADASLVVNNNAAATLLILSALASGGEVICSRGEMVEIGGSFRIPDVMEASGCKLVAVGCTNKTHLADYENAITPETKALLVVHTSNYRVVGFTASPELEKLRDLARAHDIPLIHDLGSGSLLSPEELGFGDEPPVHASFKAGADVVCMSGDKLLGGPQAGIILGRNDLVTRMRKHPLARALRVDKSTLAGLEATLQLFLDPPRLKSEHPVLRMLTLKPEDLRGRAAAMEAALVGLPDLEVRQVEMSSETGSGAMPTIQIPSLGVGVRIKGWTAQGLARRLRNGTPGIFTRIVDDWVCSDLRTLFEGEELEVAAGIQAVLGENRS